MPTSDHAIWPILRLAVVGFFSVWAVSRGYAEGWVTRADLPVVFSILGPLLGFDVVKHIAVKHVEGRGKQ